MWLGMATVVIHTATDSHRHLRVVVINTEDWVPGLVVIVVIGVLQVIVAVCTEAGGLYCGG